MNLNDIHKIYFIGIGGIGMSALARYFHGRGVEVFGYDKTETQLTRTLAAEGMDIHYTDNPTGIPEGIDLVVFTPAVPSDLKELEYFRSKGYAVKKRSEVLGIISRGMKTAAIAGTHGKTTTSSLCTWLLRSGGIDCSAFLGGIVRNFGSNFVEGRSEWVVAEADEYDRSFLQLDPDLAVILSMDADHLDIYGDRESMVETGYKAFAARLKPGGKLFVQHRWAAEFPGARSFGIDAGDCRAENVRAEEGFFAFDYVSDEAVLRNLRSTMPGRHNVENAVAAISIALAAGAQEEGIRRGLEIFTGIQRRFEIVYRDREHVYVDDYAHHPSELEAVIGAAREFFPGRKITGVFQPHLYSRTRDFAAGFAQALDRLDEVLLLDIYPAREAPIPGVSADTIAGLMKNKSLVRIAKPELMEELKKSPIEVLLTVGAGDIDTLVEPIRKWLAAETKNERKP
ncbi:MAG: UDP-N-acetylmuramate--L-alanine ligase [Saprospiraceae bacterium]|nr:UDP-N-acetylmuramate--L-alanine ligase [Saprospiraceae bacterium]